MPKRQMRCDGLVYHVLNRAAKRSLLFASADDYSALEQILREAKQRTSMRVLAYCIMPNHWHLVLWPNTGIQMSQFMHWFTLTHAQRWQAFHQTVGTGAVYQGRYKAIPIQTDNHFLNVCRYVERNPLRAGLVERAEHWAWSSLWLRCNQSDHELLGTWPISQPEQWLHMVNGTEERDDLETIRAAVRREIPLGDSEWTQQTAQMLGLESRLRPRGRPKKAPGAFFPSLTTSELFPRR